MKYRGLYTFDTDTHKYVPISSIKEIWDIEEDAIRLRDGIVKEWRENA